MIQKRRTTDIHKISVVRLIIYSYSECLFLKVKLLLNLLENDYN